MRIITIPATVELKDVKGDPLPFKKWLIFNLDTYEAVRTPSMVRQAAKIVGIIEDAKETISLEDAQYDTVNGSLQKSNYAPIISRQLLSYYDAVEKAEEIKK